MFVEARQMSIRIFDAYSLKDKRSTIKSIIKKVHNKFNVSISEVDEHDLMNKATLGIAIVSNSNTLNDQILNRIVTYIEDNYEIEIIAMESYF